MVITKIEEQKKNKKRCSVFLDGEYYCSIDREILKEVNIYEGMSIDEYEFNSKMEIINYKSALKSALSMLVRAPRTESELVSKLRQKDYPESAIEKVVEYLKGAGYINDEAYAESMIRGLKDNKGCSRRSLYSKLSQKGIKGDIIQQKLEDGAVDEFDTALKAALQKLHNLKGDKRDKFTKLYAFLFRKGYGSEVARRVISELNLEADGASNFSEFFE